MRGLLNVDKRGSAPFALRHALVSAAIAALSLVPAGFAAADTTDALVSKFGTYIIDPILLVLFSAGFFMFMWGLFQFMVNINRGEDTGDGKRHMIYGTLGMLIMVSVYGILALLNNTFGLSNSYSNTNVNNVSTPNVTFIGSGN